MERLAMSEQRRFAVWHRDGFTCTYCKRSALEHPIVLHVDHIVSLSAGGSEDLENLTTACRDCNLSKGSRAEPRRQGPRRIPVEPADTERISVRLGRDQLAWIRAEAKARRMGVAPLIRELVQEALDAEDRVAARIAAQDAAAGQPEQGAA